MEIIFHKQQPLGKISVERNTSQVKHRISIIRNGVLLEEHSDYSLRNVDNEKEITIIQDFNGLETEVMTLITHSK